MSQHATPLKGHYRVDIRSKVTPMESSWVGVFGGSNHCWTRHVAVAFFSVVIKFYLEMEQHGTCTIVNMCSCTCTYTVHVHVQALCNVMNQILYSHNQPRMPWHFSVSKNTCFVMHSCCILLKAFMSGRHLSLKYLRDIVSLSLNPESFFRIKVILYNAHFFWGLVYM